MKLQRVYGLHWDDRGAAWRQKRKQTRTQTVTAKQMVRGLLKRLTDAGIKA